MSLKSNIDSKVYYGLLTHLQSMAGGYPIVEPGEVYPTDAGTPFIVVQDVRFDPDSPYIGGSTADENRGNFNLAVMTPLAWSHTQNLGVAGQIASHFPKGEKIAYSDVLIQLLQTPKYVGNSFRDAGFMRTPIDIRWRCAG